MAIIALTFTTSLSLLGLIAADDLRPLLKK
jgi:hypothetical protein